MKCESLTTEMDYREPQQLTNPHKYVGKAVLAVAMAVLSSILEVQGAELCVPTMALVVSVQGVVELRRATEKKWQPALLNSALCPGDSIRVRQRGRAALRLNNDTMLRLDQKTTLTLRGLDNDKITLMEMLTGGLHVLTRTPTRFKIKTPFLNAGVEGTEFFIGLERNEAKLVVYEGVVSVSNEYGNLILADNEAATISRDQAPKREAMIRPTDAVQWALYYPTIIDDRYDEKAAGSSALRASIEHHQHGQLAEVLSALENAPQSERSPFLLTYYAGLLLSVGRVDEAKLKLDQAFILEPGSSGANALQAIIAVVQNDTELALLLATKAVDLDRAAPTARIALSYAQQAHFKIEDALESIKEAVKLDPQNALAWARLAELHMSVGYLDRALEAARQAVKLNHNLSRTQTVLGFTFLTQIDTGAAKVAFAKAIELDQADPMPRLGMGLAKIREGDLEGGRVDLEIAASLDPANSLSRSYLGKAYFEEKRYELAGTQFNLAKERDPNDPTPWLYDGIMKQTQNQPVEALQDIQKSIELNDNRAVYRSQLLLDQDQAARGSSLARIYDNLGFERRALMETSKSLTFDPASHSSHRFLSDSYLNVPWQEIARVSELLQAQLLQPINVNPVQPHLAVADLNIITGTGPAVAGFNEFTPLLERKKPQLVASGIAGSHGTLGNETVFSSLFGRASVSVGQFHHETNGFRKNNDQTHNIYNAFFQYAVTPSFNIQAEIRRRKSEHGDVLIDFNPKTFKSDRRELEEDTARIGARYSFSPKHDFIFSGLFSDRNADNISFTTSTITTTDTTRDRGYQAEGQYLLRENQYNVTAGGGLYQIDVGRDRNVDLKGASSSRLHLGRPDFVRERNNAYVYANILLPRNISGTLGTSYDSFKEGTGFGFHKINPKFGLQWDINKRLRLRFAWFETVKSALVANQTLEPTQVAGFNQLFDDVNGTRAQRKGIGLDTRILDNIYSGIELSERDLKVPIFNPFDFSLSRVVKQQEHIYRAYFYWLPHPYWSFNSEIKFEKYSQHPSDAGTDPSLIETLSGPVSLNYFHTRGMFAKLTTTYVRQELRRGRGSTTSNTGVNDFVLLDSVIGYRFSNRRGILSLEGRNLTNEDFFYRNINLQVSDRLFYNQRYFPDRTLFLRLTLNF